LQILDTHGLWFLTKLSYGNSLYFLISVRDGESRKSELKIIAININVRFQNGGIGGHE